MKLGKNEFIDIWARKIDYGICAARGGNVNML